MPTYNYEVHDEDGCLRVFYTLSQAQRFAGHDYKIVKVKEERPRRPKFDPYSLEPALF
jgi:hypothetical protein